MELLEVPDIVAMASLDVNNVATLDMNARAMVVNVAIVVVELPEVADTVAEVTLDVNGRGSWGVECQGHRVACPCAARPRYK